MSRGINYIDEINLLITEIFKSHASKSIYFFYVHTVDHTSFCLILLAPLLSLLFLQCGPIQMRQPTVRDFDTVHLHFKSFTTSAGQALTQNSRGTIFLKVNNSTNNHYI